MPVQLLRYLDFLTRSRCHRRAVTSFGCLSPSLLTSLTNALRIDKTASTVTFQNRSTSRSVHCPVLQEYVSLQVNYIVYVRACVGAYLCTCVLVYVCACVHVCLPVDVYACMCGHACVYARVPSCIIFFLTYINTVQCTVMLNKQIHNTYRCPDANIHYS